MSLYLVCFHLGCCNESHTMADATKTIYICLQWDLAVAGMSLSRVVHRAITRLGQSSSKMAALVGCCQTEVDSTGSSARKEKQWSGNRVGFVGQV